MGNINQETMNQEEAYLCSMAENFPDEIQHQIIYAEYLWDADRDAEALDLLERTLERHPEQPECLALRHEILRAEEIVVQAEAWEKQSQLERDVDVDDLLQATRQARRADQYQLALVYAELAMREKPRKQDRQVEYVRALSSVGKYAKCIEVGEPVLKQYPKNTTVLLSLGQAHAKAGRTKQALDYLKRGIDLEPYYDELKSSYIGHRAGKIPGVGLLMRMIAPLEYAGAGPWLVSMIALMSYVPYVLGLFKVELPGGHWTQLALILLIGGLTLHATLLNLCHRSVDVMNVDPRLKVKHGHVVAWLATAMMLASYPILGFYLVSIHAAEGSAYFVVYPMLVAMSLVNQMMVYEQKGLNVMGAIGFGLWVICSVGLLVHLFPYLDEIALHEVFSWVMYITTVVPVALLILLYAWGLIVRTHHYRYAQRVKKEYLRQHPRLV